MHVSLWFYLHPLMDVGLFCKQTDGLCVTLICLCSQVCLPRSGPFYKPLFMGSERPPLANNWRLDCSVSIWRVRRDHVGPAVLWKRSERCRSGRRWQGKERIWEKTEGKDGQDREEKIVEYIK